MASRKQLKKSIKMISGELFADCVALSMCQQADHDKLEGLMAEIVAMNLEFVSRISHTEKGQEKLFYKKLADEFTQKANELSERIVKA